MADVSIPHSISGVAPADTVGRVTQTSEDATHRRLRYQQIRLAGLDEADYRQLFAELGSVMEAALGESGAGWARKDWASRYERFRESATVTVVTNSERIVGFLAYRIYRIRGRACLHFMSGYILPEFQGRGIAYAMNARAGFRFLARRPLSRYFMIADVLNPIVATAWRTRVSDASDVFPQFGAIEPRDELRATAGEVAGLIYPSCAFDPTNGVLRGKTLPRPSETVPTGDDEVDAFFAAHVDPENGDTVLLVLDGNRGALARGAGELLRALPRALRLRARPRWRRRHLPVGGRS